MSVTVGLSSLHYSIMTDGTDEIGGSPVYATPVLIPGLITANINPNPQMETLFADDGPTEVATALGEISLEIGVKALPTAVQAALLGHTHVNGRLVKKSTDTPPWVAVGFKSLKSDGDYKYVWLTKGKFQLPEQAHETKSDSINFQTPSITGAFVKRDCDDVWQYAADEGDGDFTDEATWFTTATIAAGATWTATFTVDDGTDPIVGASVIFNGRTIVTGAGGTAVFTGISDGANQPYSVYASGKNSVFSSVTVDGANVTPGVTMTPV